MSFRTSTLRGTGAVIAVAALAATVATLVSAAGAQAGGGLGTGGDHGDRGSKGGSGTNMTPAKYHRLWSKVGKQDKRWAERVAVCESGKNPNATALNGRYRGAFMFTRDAWRTSPKSPGGDPIDYSYKTQAVVAVHLKKRDGTRPWPVCG